MSMRRPRHNMGRAEWIGAEAVGVPGQRTFRLMAFTHDMAAQLWLEKEQLQALAEAIARMLVEIDPDQPIDIRSDTPAPDNPKPPDFPPSPEIEFQVGAMGLRYDPQRDLIALEASERDAPEDDPPVFRCLGTRQQMEALKLNSIDVITAGRPRCPLCGTPLSAPGMPHFCPRTNGHQKLTPEEE
jgi:uncharacterized repeat protein (TIGR03847 family)